MTGKITRTEPSTSRPAAATPFAGYRASTAKHSTCRSPRGPRGCPRRPPRRGRTPPTRGAPRNVKVKDMPNNISTSTTSPRNPPRLTPRLTPRHHPARASSPHRAQRGVQRPGRRRRAGSVWTHPTSPREPGGRLPAPATRAPRRPNRTGWARSRSRSASAWSARGRLRATRTRCRGQPPRDGVRMECRKGLNYSARTRDDPRSGTPRLTSLRARVQAYDRS